jgi:hypothetical protein
MSTIRVKITDSSKPEGERTWFASAWCPPGQSPIKAVAGLNRKAKLVRHLGKVTYELATESEYQDYIKSISTS